MDDEVLGCGGTIIKHINIGDIVDVCFLTDSSSTQYYADDEKRRKKYFQAQSVKDLLGIRQLFFLEFEDMKLDSIPISSIAKKLSEIVKNVNPDIIYTHHKGDLNKDHRVAHEATLIAARPHTKIKAIYSYEVLSTTEIGIHNFTPDHFIDITDFIDRKKEAFNVYEDEIREYPHARSLKGIEVLASYRGIMCHSHYAEAFQTVRRIE